MDRPKHVLDKESPRGYFNDIGSEMYRIVTEDTEHPPPTSVFENVGHDADVWKNAGKDLGKRLPYGKTKMWDMFSSGDE